MTAPGEEDAGGNPLQEGIYADGGWQNRMKRDESFASVRTANEDWDDWDDDDFGGDYGGYDAEADPRRVTSRFIVGPNGQVYRPTADQLRERDPSEIFHEDIANANGIKDMYNGHSHGEYRADGSITFPVHQTPFDAQAMQQILDQHYPNAAVDPGLQAGEATGGGEAQRAQELMQGFDPRRDPQTGIRRNELNILEGPPLRGMRQRAPNPWERSEGILRGGKLEGRDTLYLPWSRETSSVDADFEVTQVIPEGPHTVEVDANGESNPVILQHDNPEVLDAAKQRLQARTAATVVHEPFGIHNGVLDGLHRLAGKKPGLVLDNQPAEQWIPQMWDRFRQQGMFNPGPVQVEHPNPNWERVASEILQEGHDGPIWAYLAEVKRRRQQQQGQGPVARVAQGPLLPFEIGAGERFLGGHLLSGLVRGALGGGGGQQPSAPAPEAPPEDAQALSSVHAQLTLGFDSPTSLPKREDTDDPEDVDPHEFNDGDQGPLGDLGVNDAGGTDGIHMDQDGELGQALEAALPSLIHFFHSDESGADDPAIQHLLDLIQQQKPHLLEIEPDDDSLAQLNDIKLHDNNEGGDSDQHTANLPPLQQMDVDPVSNPSQQTNPASQGQCPSCGARLTPGTTVCPQCGSSIMNTQQNAPQQMQPVHAGNQGPHNAEQFKMVAEFLQQSGRQDELSNLVLHPEQYGDELAQIQGKDQPPDPDPDPGPPPAMPPQGMPIDQGQMPMPGPGMPMQGSRRAGVEDFIQQQYMPEKRQEINPDVCPQCGQPLRNGVCALHGPAQRTAADNVAERCPKCKSHTTGFLMDDDNSQYCSSCGNIWSNKDVVKVGADEDSNYAPNPPLYNTPAADQEGQYDAERDADSARDWLDASGSPLQVGQEYQMTSNQYDIPDLVRIEAVRPGSIDYTLTGEYGLEHRTTITKQEALEYGYQFEPAGQGDSQPVDETANSDNTGYVGTPDQDNLALHSKTAAPPQSMDYIEAPDIPEEMQINEYRKWRNKSTLPSVECWHCGEQNPSGTQQCMSCGSQLDPINAPKIGKQAGKKYSPMEQREFIDEPGTARNSDKLDLSNTHYEAGLVEDSFLWGL